MLVVNKLHFDHMVHFFTNIRLCWIPSLRPISSPLLLSWLPLNIGSETFNVILHQVLTLVIGPISADRKQTLTFFGSIKLITN